MKKPNLYNYESQYNSCKKRLEKHKHISKGNKEIISSYVRDNELKGNVAIPTILKYYDVLTNISIGLKKDFDKLTKTDFEKIVERINARDVSISTKQKFWTVIKKFGNWLSNGDKIFNGNGFAHDYPETVAWINTNVKGKDLPKIKASDILTEEEVDKLISSTDGVRDKCFLSVLYETGSRISEIGNITIGDVTEQDNGYLIDLASGKTGERNVIVVFSSSKLSAWLNQHPKKDDKNAPLWVILSDNNNNRSHRGEKLNYRSLYKIVARAKKKSKIDKKIHPHIFRHSRVTHLLVNKQLNEQQAKVYFGWCPSSKQLASYSHLQSSDVNRTMLEINGVKPIETEVNGKKARICPNCKKPNDSKDNFCGFCSKPLDFKTLMGQQEAIKQADEGVKMAFEKDGKVDDDSLRNAIREMIKEEKTKDMMRDMLKQMKKSGELKI